MRTQSTWRRFSISISAPGGRRALRSAASARSTRRSRLALAPVFRPLAGSARIERHVPAQALDEGDALIGVKRHLIREAVTEGPDDQIRRASVLEVVRLGILRQVADALPGGHGDALLAVMQRSLALHHDQNLLLEEVLLPPRRESSRCHGLNH